MTTKEAIKAIKDYLRYSNVSENQFSDIVFQDEEATLNGKALFFFIHSDGGMDLMNLEYEDICSLNMDILVELFDSLYFQVYCEWCSGNHEDCNHENVIYKN